MTQNDNMQSDTPQTQEQEFQSLEEAVFGGEGSGPDTIESAFTSGNDEATEPAPQGQPEVRAEETQETPPQTNNDETRYQYWQSQADKYKNELEQLKTKAPEPIAQQPVETQAPVEEFPAAPEKPQRPRAFNREEAYSDPSSESARYLDDLESWRDDVSEYNSLKSQYQTAIVEEKLNKMEQDKVEEAKRQQAAQQKSAQEAEVKSHVMGHYGMSDGEANDFMSKMSDPNSITIDNLVQLYRMQSGGGTTTAAPAKPSETFTQTKNAQQVPSPMGVMPSGQTNSDSKVGNFNNKNPWK